MNKKCEQYYTCLFYLVLKFEATKKLFVKYMYQRFLLKFKKFTLLFLQG